MMTEEHANDKHNDDTEALQRVLRRRKRRTSARANSGEPVKAWAQFQSVQLKPTGSYSQFWRWVFAILFALLIGGLLLALMLIDPVDF